MIARDGEKEGLGKMLLAGAKSIAAGRKEGADGVCLCAFARARARARPNQLCADSKKRSKFARARARYFETLSFPNSEERNAPRRAAARSTPQRLGQALLSRAVAHVRCCGPLRARLLAGARERGAVTETRVSPSV